MRQQQDFEVPRWDSSQCPGAAAASGVDIPRQRTGHSQLEAPSPYPVLLRDGQPRQPRFQPASRQTAAGLTLVFFGLFCLVGAWWLHLDHLRGHEPAVIAQPTAAFTYPQAITALTRACTQDSVQLQNMVGAVRAREARAGIAESATTVAWELASYTAANSRPVSCVPQFAAFTALRTGGK